MSEASFEDEAKQWEALKAGDLSALQQLYNHHVQSLYRYGMMLVKDEEKVKDHIQDLFLACWTNRSGMSIPASGKAYLMVSLRRRIFDKGPKSRPEMISMEDHDVDRDMDMDPEARWVHIEEESERKQKLEKAMSRLSDRQREIIHMKYFEQMEYDDIARMMDLNYQSARNLVTRALMALRREMLVLALIFMGWM